MIPQPYGMLTQDGVSTDRELVTTLRLMFHDLHQMTSRDLASYYTCTAIVQLFGYALVCIRFVRVRS